MKRNLLRILPFLLLGGALGLTAAPAAFEVAETKADVTFPINNSQEFAGVAVSGWDITPQTKYCSLYYSGGQLGASTITNKNIGDFSVFSSGTYSLKVYVSGICNGGDANNTLAVTMIDSAGITVGDTISKTKQLGGGDSATKAKESSVYTFTPTTSVTGLKIEIGLKCALTKVRWNITKVSDDDPEPIKPATYYTKVTDAASLQVGQTIVLGCKDKNAVAGAFSTNILTSKTAVFEDDKVYSNDAEEITLGGAAGNWKLLVSEGQIGTSEIGKFNLTSDTEWSISITGGVATIETANYGSIQYNVSNPRFVNYTSSQTPIEIYKKDGAIETYTVTYDANSGGTGSVIDSNSPYNKASSVTVLENAFTPITGKAFVEWNTSADGTGISYDAGDVFTIMGDTTLYAIWEDEYIPTGDLYTKVTDVSELAAGDKVVIADSASNYAIGSLDCNSGKTQYFFNVTPCNFVEGKLNVPADSDISVLTLGKNGSYFTFSCEKGLIGAKEVKAFSFASGAVTDWTIQINGSGNAIIKNKTESYGSIQRNGTIKFVNYATTQGPVELYKKSGVAKQVVLEESEVSANVGFPVNLSVKECIGFEPTSYSWEVTEGSDVVSISSGQNTDKIELSTLKEGQAEVCVTVNGVMAKATVIVSDYKYDILDATDYFISTTSNKGILGFDISNITDPDFGNTDNQWHFEKAYTADNSYYLTNKNNQYLTYNRDIPGHESDSKQSLIIVYDEPISSWIVSQNDAVYKVATVTKSNGTRSLAQNADDNKWYAFDGNNYVNLLKGGTYDHFEVDSLPTKKQYFVGDTLNTTNCHVYACYSNGYRSEITKQITWDTLTAGSKAYGKCTILGEEVDIEMDGLQIYKGDASTFVVNGLRDTFYAGERINKDNLTVSITYKFPGAEDIVKDKLLKDDYVIEPEKIQETTTSVKISLAKDPTVYVEKNITVVQNSYVAAAHIHEGDKIVIGTLGYDSYEIKGGYELTYDDKFGYSTFDYMPHGELPLEVGKKDGYYTLKDPGTGYFLKGDNSAFGFHKPDWKSAKTIENHQEFNANVKFSKSVQYLTIKTCDNPDFSDPGVFANSYYKGGSYQITWTSDLTKNEIYFEMWTEVSGVWQVSDTATLKFADWKVDNGIFSYCLEISSELPDECLFTLNYDDDYEEWVISSKPHQDKQLYYNKDGKFGFYEKGSSYTPVMVFRDNNLPLESNPTSLSVSFRTYETEEGPVPMNTVSVGEQFPWTSALIVKVNYGGGASKVIPVGGYTIKQMPDTSKIGPSKGIISYGQIGHEKEVEFTIYVTGHTQAFEIKGDRDPVLVGEECQLRVEPAAPEGEPIKWSVDHPEFASISETGLLKGIAPGYINVTATSFDGTYSDTVKIRIYQQVESVTLDKHEVELKAGETSQLTATVKPDNASNKNVTYSSSDTSVAFVDEKTGLITGVSEGTATITCAAQNHPERNFDTCEVTVKPAPIVHVTSIKLDCTQKDLDLTNHKTFNLIATISPENATIKNVIWSSNHDNIATVDQNGKVTAKAKGECEITATAVDGGLTAKCTINVKSSVTPVPVTKVTLNATSKKIAVNEVFDLIATIEPGNADEKQVTFTSSNDSIAKVDQYASNGAKITGLKDGVAAITARCGGKEATCTVTVGNGTVPVTSVSLSETSVELFTNETKTLTARINPSDATNKNVTWTSSDTNIVTVDSNGKITAVKEGTATITVTTVDGGKTATCSVTVKKGNTPTPDGGDDHTVAIIIGTASGVAAVGVGCGIGIPLGIKSHKKRKLGK